MALTGHLYLAEEERFELSRELAPPYSFSKAAPSATWVLLRVAVRRTFRLIYCITPGGEGEIRTLGSFYTTTVFKTVTINHSVTSPRGLIQYSIVSEVSLLVERLASNQSNTDVFYTSITKRLCGCAYGSTGRVDIIQHQAILDVRRLVYQKCAVLLL